jgi:hypothetical protein
MIAGLVGYGVRRASGTPLCRRVRRRLDDYVSDFFGRSPSTAAGAYAVLYSNKKMGLLGIVAPGLAGAVI